MTRSRPDLQEVADGSTVIQDKVQAEPLLCGGSFPLQQRVDSILPSLRVLSVYAGRTASGRAGLPASRKRVTSNSSRHSTRVEHLSWDTRLSTTYSSECVWAFW